VLLGVTERLEFIDAPRQAADLTRYRPGGYAMRNNRNRLLTDQPQCVVEIHPPSANSVEMAGVTVENFPPRPTMD
jgi:hypothetical protein